MVRKRVCEKHISDKVSRNEKARQRYASLSREQKDLLLKKQRDRYRMKKQQKLQDGPVSQGYLPAAVDTFVLHCENTATTFSQVPLTINEPVSTAKKVMQLEVLNVQKKLKERVSEFSIYEKGSSSNFACVQSGQHAKEFNKLDEPAICSLCYKFLIESMEDVQGFSVLLPQQHEQQLPVESLYNIKTKSCSKRRYFRHLSRNSRQQIGKELKKGPELLSHIVQEPDELPKAGHCKYCGAKKFYSETANFCCSDGEVLLQENKLPDMLIELFTGQSAEAICFRTYVRTYNSLFAFSSFGVSYDKNLCKRSSGVYTFKVQGQTYHFINELIPQGRNGMYLQLYFHDTEHELKNRMAFSEKLTESIVSKLMIVMEQNPYACFFRSLRNVPNLDSCQIILSTHCDNDQRIFNKPTVSQVAALWVEGSESQQAYTRHIRVYTKEGHSQRIQYYYGCYDPLQYPLLHPYGETGWHAGIKTCDTKNPKKRKKRISKKKVNVDPRNATSVEELIDNEEQAIKQLEDSKEFVSMREYYAYKFQIRPDNTPTILNSGRVLQQYAVDMYVKIETQRLDYFRSRQIEIRTEQLQGIMDCVVQGECSGSNIGQRVILPATFIGGPRDMKRRYMDAMALVQRFGKPDIFLTMTCNPSWKEIKEKLIPTDEAQNRPDLEARVFHAKLNVLKDELFKKEIFGQVAAYTYVIEFQKRGLPHAHFLIIMKPCSKLYSTDSYDHIVCAELPDKNEHPHLYKMVKKHMMHGPCGKQKPDNVCMQHGRCKNKYPKDWSDETIHAPNGYPIYRRRNDGRFVLVRGCRLDNRWVVPYNPYLLAKFNCHINVEICSTIKAVKYLFKYIYKGHDRINFQLNSDDGVLSNDEIHQYQSARWVSPVEAMWRIYRFPLNEMSPSVIRLQLHLENFQPMNFNKKQDLRNVLKNQAAKRSMLTEFFQMNATDATARSLKCTYKEFPEHFVWNKSTRMWERRKTKEVIGRIVTANPSEGERYFLRLLLQHVRAPTSFDDLKTINGMYVDTFREAAMLRDLFEADNPQELCLEEACNYDMPHSLRRLFATILVYFPPTNAKQLWQKFEPSLSEDFAKISGLSSEEIRYRALKHISDVMESMGKNINSFGLVPRILKFHGANNETRDTTSEMCIIVSEDELLTVELLNADQKFAFDAILKAIYVDKKGCFFVDGPGGTGKTFLYRALLAEIRSKGDIALATASCGVAASILPGGRTAHSRFKIPIDTDGANICRISKQTGLAKLLQQARLIIWDEAPMANKYCIEAVNEVLKDLMDSDEVFGSKVMVFGGDFRQVLPVIPNGGRTDFVEASLVKSYLWEHLTKLHLKENMRAKSDPSFMNLLLSIGNGTFPKTHDDNIIIPKSFLIPFEDENVSLQILIKSVYPSFDEFFQSELPSMNKAILTTKNEFVDEINNTLIQTFPGLPHEYVSRDKALENSDQAIFEDFLNGLTPNGFPPHKLILKPNCPIILLRNIDPPEGLCNGTRLLCKSLKPNLIDAVISGGQYAGKQVFLHRIQFRATADTYCPIPFERTQFPVRLCFAMTINKAQGQTLDFVGIYLREPVFSHGQLYVAMSRAKKASCVKILIRPPLYDSTLDYVTKNVVYEEVLELTRHA